MKDLKFFSVRIPKELFKYFKIMSVQKDVTMNELIEEMIDKETTKHFENLEKEENSFYLGETKKDFIKNKQLINV
jgi:hypothetical protein